MRWFTLYALPGAVGSTFLTIGAFGVGWFPLRASVTDVPLVHYMQTETLGLAVARSFVVVGAALLLQAWLVVGADTLHHGLLDVRTVQLVMVAWCAPLVVAPPLFSRDVYSYYMQGRVLTAGGNPYQDGVSVVPGWFTSGVDPMWADAKTPYGPAFLVVEKAIAALVPQSPYLGAFAFRLVALAGVAMLVLALPALARAHGIDPASAVWLGALNPLVVMHLVAGAHNDALMIGLTVAALAAASSATPLAAVTSAVLVGLAVAVKPVAVVAMPFIAYQCARDASWRARAQAAALTGGLVSATLILLSLVVNVGPLGWLDALATPGSVRSWLSPMTGLGIGWGNFMQVIGFAHFQETSVAIMRATGSVLLGVTLMYLALRPGGRSAVRSTALSFAALVALGPVVQPWYLLWALPLFAATGLTRTQVREVITVVALFTLHGIANSAATADTFLEFSDGVAILFAAVVVGLVVASSRRERTLILDAEPMAPRDAQQRAAAAAVALA